MDYTICSNLVALSSDHKKYLYDLLWKIVLNTSIKVASNYEILSEYQSIGLDSEEIRAWISGMDFNDKWKTVKIVPNSNIYIETCKRTYDKKLIVREKEDYLGVLYNGIDVYDKDEAIAELINPTTIIYQQGKGNQLSTGNNSPNEK